MHWCKKVCWLLKRRLIHHWRGWIWWNLWWSLWSSSLLPYLCLTCFKNEWLGMVASKDASCTCWGTWALGPPPSLSREGRVPGQDTFSMNYSTVRMDHGGATTCKLCINKICPWWRLWSMDSKCWESWADGPRRAGVGVVEVEGASGVEEEGTSASRSLAFHSPLKLSVRSSIFQQFFLM